MSTMNQERYLEVQLKGLEKGTHKDPHVGMCAMEAASYIAGEPFSDHPLCVCPVIATFMREMNDQLPKKEREQTLMPLIPTVLGTFSVSYELKQRRILRTLLWMTQEYLPMWLDLLPPKKNGIEDVVKELRTLEKLEDIEKTLVYIFSYLRTLPASISQDSKGIARGIGYCVVRVAAMDPHYSDIRRISYQAFDGLCMVLYRIPHSTVEKAYITAKKSVTTLIETLSKESV